MTVDDLKQSLGVTKDYELAAKLNRNKSTISKWRANGVPKQARDLIGALSTHRPKTATA